MPPANRNVIIAIDDSDYAEFAFDCEYVSYLFMSSFYLYLLQQFLKSYYWKQPFWKFQDYFQIFKCCMWLVDRCIQTSIFLIVIINPLSLCLRRFIMPPTSKNLRGHIGLDLSVFCLCVRPLRLHTVKNSYR